MQTHSALTALTRAEYTGAYNPGWNAHFHKTGSIAWMQTIIFTSYEDVCLRSTLQFKTYTSFFTIHARERPYPASSGKLGFVAFGAKGSSYKRRDLVVKLGSLLVNSVEQANLTTRMLSFKGESRTCSLLLKSSCVLLSTSVSPAHSNDWKWITLDIHLSY